MKVQLGRLIQLQTIDNRIGLLKSRTAQIPERLRETRKSLEGILDRLNRCQAEKEAASRQKREREGELELCESQLSKARDRMTAIKTNKEYQAHLQEMETIRVEKGRVEEELIILMEKMDDHLKREGELAQAVSVAEKEFAETEKRLNQEGQKLQQELEGFEKEREGLLPQIDRDLLKSYQHIKGLRRDYAVVPIQNGICGGCHMNVPPQRIAEVKTGGQILSCTECQRILYWPGTVERAPVASPGGSS